jgi:hypothetical protein
MKHFLETATHELIVSLRIPVRIDVQVATRVEIGVKNPTLITRAQQYICLISSFHHNLISLVAVFYAGVSLI